MAIRKTEAIVLKRMLLRETSLIVTLFGREVGKFSVLAKGVRRDKRLRAAAFEPFTHLHILYYEKTKSALHLFSDLSVIRSNALLRLRFDVFTYASYLIDLVDTFFGNYDPHPEVFDLLLESFSLFEAVSPVKVVRGFEIKLFELIGWLPVLDHCVHCGASASRLPVSPPQLRREARKLKRGEPAGQVERSFFSAKQGGILCAQCERRESGVIPISQKTAEILMDLSRTSLSDAVKLDFDYQTLRELERISQRFIQFRLDYPLKSRRFLSEVQNFLIKI